MTFPLLGLLFIPVVQGQGTEEQKAKWVPLSRDYKIIGAYAQTEMGHGECVCVCVCVSVCVSVSECECVICDML